jgi:hypothetical protein
MTAAVAAVIIATATATAAAATAAAAAVAAEILWDPLVKWTVCEYARTGLCKCARQSFAAKKNTKILPCLCRRH